MADAALYTHAGPEIGVASTKCFTTQLVAMLLLAVYLGRRRDVLPQEEARRILDALTRCPQQMRDVLAKEDDVRHLAKRYMRSEHMLFLGRGTGYPIALEGALKLKEVSYIHAEGYAAGEMKHGPIALIDEDMPVVALCPRDVHYEKTLSNMQEVKAREGQLIAICTEGDTDVVSLLASESTPVELPAHPSAARAGQLRRDPGGRPGGPSSSRGHSRCSFSPTTSPISKGPTSTSRGTWPRR